MNNAKIAKQIGIAVGVGVVSGLIVSYLQSKGISMGELKKAQKEPI